MTFILESTVDLTCSMTFSSFWFDFTRVTPLFFYFKMPFNGLSLINSAVSFYYSVVSKNTRTLLFLQRRLLSVFFNDFSFKSAFEKLSVLSVGTNDLALCLILVSYVLSYS